MRKETYIKKIAKHQESFTKQFNKIVQDTNDFKKTNPNADMRSLGSRVEHFADELALSSAWIYDIINDAEFKSKKSMRFKIRKALGYTYH